MLSNNFSRAEFECQCGQCDYDTVDAELIIVLQSLRDYIGKPITITSGNRCPEHNVNIGGTKNSYHVKGRAADIQVKGVSASVIQSYLDETYPDEYGIGFYSTFTHIDTRTNKGRWYG